MSQTSEARDTLSRAIQGRLFKVSPYMILPSKSGRFSLFLKQDDNLVLYAEKGERFTEAHKQRLGAMGVEHLYVRTDEQTDYVAYVRDNLLDILENESIPVRERGRAWNDATQALAREVFDRGLPKPLNGVRFQKIRSLIKSSLRFLAREDALREIARFISEGREIYHHGIGVMVFTTSMLGTFVKDDADLMVAAGMGAMLHDIGKLELPRHLFSRPLDELSPEDQALVRSHPALGVGVCSALPLPQQTLQCILFHHEREDGSGYPSGAQGELMPAYVKVLALCNEYDNLTRGTEYRKPFTPFEALTHIKARRNQFDLDMLKRLIVVLSKADLA